MAKNDTQQHLGFETTLWAAADKLRGNLDPSEYKHVVLGLIFLKYVSDAFDERRAWLETAVADPDNDEYYVDDPDAREVIVESRDEYLAENVFWVPKEARWSTIQAAAKQPDIGQIIDQAMDAVERENDRLKGVLPKDYGRPALDKRRLGELVDLIATIGLTGGVHREKDVLGRVYEYFLSQFADSEGKGGGEFYTPQSVVQLLVNLLEPFHGRVYDPACGSGGMFVQSMRFVEAHGGSRRDLSVYGQELNYATWRLARMNLAIRGIEANLGDEPADTFHDDKHPDLRADFVLANPPFNISDWGGEQLRSDPRWRFGDPPAGNANFAWVQHMVSKLAPGGTAGIVLANGSMSSTQGGEDVIREKLVEQDVVDCLVALPGQLFYSTPIPVCLWILARDRHNHRFRDRRGHVLFIDAQRMGEMASRTHRVLTGDDIAKISDTYHAWRGEAEAGDYTDVAGFCRSVSLDEVRRHQFILTPGRFVGSGDSEREQPTAPYPELMARLTDELHAQVHAAREMDDAILARLEELRHAQQ